MKVEIIYIGRKKNASTQETELIKRINHKHQIQLMPQNSCGANDENTCRRKDSEILISKYKPDTYKILLDERGKTLDSDTFTHHLIKAHEESKTIQFIIGGAYGSSPELRDSADLIVSFGSMVWTKDLCRLMLLEQIYRGTETMAGKSFHKA